MAAEQQAVKGARKGWFGRAKGPNVPAMEHKALGYMQDAVSVLEDAGGCTGGVFRVVKTLKNLNVLEEVGGCTGAHVPSWPS